MKFAPRIHVVASSLYLIKYLANKLTTAIVKVRFNKILTILPSKEPQMAADKEAITISLSRVYSYILSYV